MKRKAFLLSVIFLFTFLLIWALATERKKIEVKSIALSTSQISELSKGQLSKPDVLSLVELGLTFEQITQISDIGVSLADIDAAGGVKAFGFTTGGVAEEATETTGFPSPALVWKESWEQLKDPFYDKGPNDKGIGIQLKYSLMRVAVGFILAIIVAVPLGFIIGMFPVANMALMP